MAKNKLAEKTAEQCNRCRFWLADTDSTNFDDEPHAFGKCRRYPPVISDHMAAVAIGLPSFGQQYDPEDLATSTSVHDACLWPVTFCNYWCGEYAAVKGRT